MSYKTATFNKTVSETKTDDETKGKASLLLLQEFFEEAKW
jgi:hypothetical protein